MKTRVLSVSCMVYIVWSGCNAKLFEGITASIDVLCMFPRDSHFHVLESGVYFQLGMLSRFFFFLLIQKKGKININAYKLFITYTLNNLTLAQLVSFVSTHHITKHISKIFVLNVVSLYNRRARRNHGFIFTL